MKIFSLEGFRADILKFSRATFKRVIRSNETLEIRKLTENLKPRRLGRVINYGQLWTKYCKQTQKLSLWNVVQQSFSQFSSATV